MNLRPLWYLCYLYVYFYYGNFPYKEYCILCCRDVHRRHASGSRVLNVGYVKQKRNIIYQNICEQPVALDVRKIFSHFQNIWWEIPKKTLVRGGVVTPLALTPAAPNGTAYSASPSTLTHHPIPFHILAVKSFVVQVIRLGYNGGTIMFKTR